MTTRRALVAAALAMPIASPTRAQANWPTRPVRLVVGFPPGGSGDFIARSLTEPLSREVGQPIVVDNRPGAGSNLATEHVARAEPDGHTLLLGGNFSHAVNPALYRRVAFDPVADFTPITRLTDLPTIIAAGLQTNLASLAQLMERVRAEPGRWNYSTPGNGTPSHLAGAMLAKVAGISLQHVPFRGGAPAIQAVLSGDVQLTIATPPVALPLARAGRIRALAMTTRLPSPVIPDVPGAEAAGLPALDVAGWWGVWGPARLPAPIRDRAYAALVKVVQDPGVRERLATEGLQAVPSASPDEFAAFVQREIGFWAVVVREAGESLE
ncbi:Bug family tripartite tricarboxylate transporter substrate binding protein [Falsiroseomonas sp. HW251]|uniref:Bug family tripartite tricarboxylate transporter substrate binding protein n=1 Tax=Falsiroseomonas sp. HW251 TaxID=3390998 RepID=UPI003D315022